MASYLVSGLVLLWLSLHASVHGRELHGVHNDYNVIAMQLASRTKDFVEKAAQISNRLSKNKGYSRGRSLVERSVNKEVSMDRPLPRFREPSPFNYKPRDASSQFVNHWAIYQSLEGVYYGTKATINVWGLQDIESSDESTTAIWVGNRGDGTLGSTNTIIAGWHVRPSLYNDNSTHFFIYWTADGSQRTGCYNLDCPGFVHVNHSLLVPGYRIEPTSNFDGVQYYITLKIYKDPETGDWLLFEGSGDARNFIGYWPKFLFTSLANSASVIYWGGGVTFSQSHTSPPMGSGHFSIDGKGKAASFTHLQYVSDKGDLYDPIHDSQTFIIDKKECYTVDELGDSADIGGSDGWMFHFGGPGGCNN